MGLRKGGTPVVFAMLYARDSVPAAFRYCSAQPASAVT
jgi:hypothetical protein